MAEHSTAIVDTALAAPAAIDTPPGGSRRLRVAEVAGCLVAADSADGRAAAVARRLPAEEGRVAVVTANPRIPIAELADALRQWVPLRWESVRLVAPHTAYSESGLSPAKELADRLGVEVVAPDGQLVAAPDGSLFVVGGQGTGGPGRAERGAWWRFRPGREPEQTGRRFPTPEWERELAGLASPGLAGVVVDEVPAGLWLRWPGEVRLTDLAYAVPVHHSTLALLVSRAGDPPLRAADLRRLVEALPVALRNRLAVIPYGDQPIADARLGAIASLAANRALRVRTGLPLRLAGRGGAEIVALGSDGAPTWLPFVREQAWGPSGSARVLSWTPPSPHLLPVGPAQLALNERWLVEVVESGLWIREADRFDGSATVRDLPLDAAHCTVVVGVFDDEQGPPPWRAIARLLQRMPPDAKARLRLAVPEAAGDRMLQSAVKACARTPEPRPVSLLTDDGRLVVPAAAESARDRGVASGGSEAAPEPPDVDAPVVAAAAPAEPEPARAPARTPAESRPAGAQPAEAQPAEMPAGPEPARVPAAVRPVGLSGPAPVVRVPDHVVSGHRTTGPKTEAPDGAAVPSSGAGEGV